MNICLEANATELCDVDMSSLVVNPVPPGGEWRVKLLEDLLQERDYNSGILSEEEVLQMIHTVCCD